MTTVSGVGPPAGPERPVSAIGFWQAQRQVAVLPKTDAADEGRFMKRSGMRRVGCGTIFSRWNSSGDGDTGTWSEFLLFRGPGGGLDRAAPSA